MEEKHYMITLCCFTEERTIELATAIQAFNSRISEMHLRIHDCDTIDILPTGLTIKSFLSDISMRELFGTDYNLEVE